MSGVVFDVDLVRLVSLVCEVVEPGGGEAEDDGQDGDDGEDGEPDHEATDPPHEEDPDDGEEPGSCGIPVVTVVMVIFLPERDSVMSQQDWVRSLNTAATTFLMENSPARPARASSTLIWRGETEMLMMTDKL